jgi:N-formylglutamate amidohydrolase
MPDYFDVVEPADAASETPVVVEIPHAGLAVPSPYLETLAAPARALARDADLLVDALYADAPAEGATLLVARASRYVIDLNRSEADVDADVVEGARAAPKLLHGLVWKTTSDGEAALTRRLSGAELEERLDALHRPYHLALARLLERKRARFGLAVLLAAHSMPSVARHARPGAESGRADVVPGTRGRTTAAACFIDAVEEHARAHSLSVRHDDPYAGGYATQQYGRPHEAVHAVQVELARRLYLDESALRPLSGRFDEARAWCRALVARLGALALAQAAMAAQ